MSDLKRSDLEPSHLEGPDPERPDLEPQSLSQRQFLKRLAGTAVGLAGFAAASQVLNPPAAEAAFLPGAAADGGDLVNTSLWVAGNATLQGPRPYIDIVGQGAKGDGVTDDTWAIQNGFNAIPANGGTIFFPPGIYVVSAPITCSNKHVRVVGSGRGVTVLKWVAAGGFQFTFGAALYRLTVQSLTLATTVNGGGVAIKASWPGFVGGPTSAPHIFDVAIGPWTGTQYWTKGIELTNASGAKIHDFDISGSNNTVSMSNGIQLLGSSTITFIASGLILFAGKGIEIQGSSEGFYLRDIECVFTTTGYEFGSVSPGSAISNCHAASDLRGIFIWGHGEVAVTGCLLYQNGDNPSGYVGIYLASNQFHRVIGNEIATTNPSGVNPRNGILLHDAHNCTVQGNVVRQMNSAIWLLGANTNIVLGNRAVLCGAVVTNAGAGNVVASNL
jgi:parallel beta-helix repeat protein